MAQRISEADLEQVRCAARVEEIISQYVTLTPSSAGSFKGLCPFHDEKTASFNVTPALGLWYCFGCNRGGDSIKFLELINHLSFREAVELLAAQYGITLQLENSASTGMAQVEVGHRQRLLEANRLAQEFYAQQLNSSAAQVGRDFLQARAFGPKAAQTFGVGFAPAGWDSLVRHLRSAGFTDQELLAAGLVKQGNRGIYDAFRGRLVWPIRDVTGQTVGFGARRLLEDDQGPKYLNTADTVLFKKSQILYGLDLAKKDIATTHRCVIVEGYTDVMAAHLSGVTTAVATCGTAFGMDHAKLVRRVIGISADPASAVLLPARAPRGGEVIFTFDADAAGQQAALRAFEADQTFAAQAFVAVVPQGKDPCDLRLEKGPDAVVQMVESRRPLFDFVLKKTIENYPLDSPAGRAQALIPAAAIVARIKDQATARYYRTKLAGWLALDEKDVFAQIRRSHQGQQEASFYPALPKNPDDVVTMRERECLAAVLRYPEYARSADFDDLPQEAFSHPTLRALFNAIVATGGVHEFADLWEETKASGVAQPRQAAMNRWANQIRKQAGPLLENMLLELANAPIPIQNDEQAKHYVPDMVTSVERIYLNSQISSAKAALQRAEPGTEKYNQAMVSLFSLEKRRRALPQEY